MLGLVAAVINSQHGCRKDEVSSYEAVYGQEFDHEVSCSEEEARQSWTLPQLLKITNNTEFSGYVSSIYHLDDGSAADDEDDDGYFSDEMLPEDERDEVTDENFLKHLVTPNSLGVNDGSAADDEDDDDMLLLAVAVARAVVVRAVARAVARAVVRAIIRNPIFVNRKH